GGRRGRDGAALGSVRRTGARMIRGVAERVWPGGVESIEPLGGGITNRNFRVVAGGETFVLRIGGEDTELLGIDRDVEHDASRAGRVELRPCHDDLLAANFIHDGERVWIVDWEYAGMGDPAFDLANFAVNNDLDEDGDRALLEAYGGGVDYDVHVLFRFMSDFREAMWGVVQQALSELDFDFAAYAEEHFERLERTAAEPRFKSALG